MAKVMRALRVVTESKGRNENQFEARKVSSVRRRAAELVKNQKKDTDLLPVLAT